ncbi:hypothetical protein GCM10027290_36260 [Micromonospora sonneratiae]
MTTPPLPHIPPGTVLTLHSADWYHPEKASHDNPHNMVIVVEKVHTDGATATAVSVWVTGHTITCTWPTSESHPPCVELRVRVDALRRTVAEGPV